MRALFYQARIELLLTIRRGESILVTLAIPVGLLAFFSKVDLLDLPEPRAAALTPGILAVAIMATAMVSLGIATGFERHYLVLKRLGGTPLGRGRLLTAKMAAVSVVELIQLVAIIAIAEGMGADLELSWGPLAGAIVLATSSFAGLGLLMAGTLRAELNLALANAVFVALLLLGGALVPLGALPGVVSQIARSLPLHPTARILGSAMGGSAVGLAEWFILTAWAIVTPLLAASTFSWQDDK